LFVYADATLSCVLATSRMGLRARLSVHSRGNVKDSIQRDAVCTKLNVLSVQGMVCSTNLYGFDGRNVPLGTLTVLPCRRCPINTKVNSVAEELMSKLHALPNGLVVLEVATVVNPTL